MASNKDESLLARIQSAISTVQAWDADRSLLDECRALIPLDILVPPADKDPTFVAGLPKSPYARDDDYLYQGNALLLQRMAYFFQKDVMTWINAPKCSHCGSSDVDHETVRGPLTPEEREGGASRVEVYKCKDCHGETCFPRYNSVRKLLETRQGRCGEYANLFGLYCRAAGFETRYILDLTDHVWVEVLVGDSWVMADSCEGIINKPSMYESGWGKKLSYILAISLDEVVDVTPRYTRNWNNTDFAARRREVCSSEAVSAQIVAQCSQRLRQGASKSSKARFEELRRMEHAALEGFKAVSVWTEEEKHGRGRISGSLQWRLSRQEGGKDNDEGEQPSVVRGLHVEQFYPVADIVTISVTPRVHGIHVSGTMCDPGQPLALSAVVVDEKHLGCILQCRAFTSLDDLATFVNTIPTHRIVVVKGKVTNATLSEKSSKILERLDGLVLPEDPTLGVIFVGQVDARPPWTICSDYAQCTGATVHLERKNGSDARRLRTELKTVPSRVAGRLPDAIMSLPSQMEATGAQKRAAFLKFAETTKRYVGYVTKKNSPVYLLNNESFPFEQREGDNPNECWYTCHFLPDVLVPEDDMGIQEEETPSGAVYDVPVATTFFSELLGTELLMKSLSGQSAVDTAAALNNTRLVGLYFSAHWCGPCRQFTPMLIEVYEHLKEEFPTHGLEMVFVSSDRDEAGFRQYYASMPWLAVPFGGPQIGQLKMRYGVRGIPSLVILDALSGGIVVAASETRGEVNYACRMGDDGIDQMFKSWLQRVPEESQELISMLELSLTEEPKEEVRTPADGEHEYLVRTETEVAPEEPTKNTETMIREAFHKLVTEGVPPNAAAAQAMKVVMSMKEAAVGQKDKASPLSDIPWSSTVFVGYSTDEPARGSSATPFHVRDWSKSLVDLQVLKSTDAVLGLKCLYSDGSEDSWLSEEHESVSGEDGWASSLDASEGDFGEISLALASDGISDIVVQQKGNTNPKEGAIVLRCPSEYTKNGIYGCVMGGRLVTMGMVTSTASDDVLVASVHVGLEKEARESVVNTLLQYVKNVCNNPSTPKFRRFKLSNKVFDRITKVEGALGFLRSLGLEVEASSQDFFASIPLATDLGNLNERLKILNDT